MASLFALLRVTRGSGLGSLLGLALIIGLAGGAVLTGAESYRRTDSAFDRLIVETEAWDVLVNPDFGTQSALRVEDIAALPGVEQVARADGLALSPRTIDSLEDLDTQKAAFASDGRWGYDFARPRIRAGRMPAVDAPDEAFLSAAPADSMGLGVPIGLVVGRLAWRTLAERLGAVVELVAPVSALGVLAVAVLGLALLVGLVPGLRAARAHPADTLRTE